ncbi:MAG: Tll0287-like domain-containing protein [bacterium]
MTLQKPLTLAIASTLLVLAGCTKNQEDATQASNSSTETQAQVVASSNHSTGDDATTQLTAESRQTVKAFMGNLKGELMAAMKAGGPVNALNVCNTKAPEITAAVSKEKGLDVSRVSLKNRNPGNTPTEWQAAVLKDFEAKKAAGADPRTLEFHEVVTVEGKQQFRYMKAIPLGNPACLICHGEAIPQDVQAKLNELYPADKATGYKLGDLRGAFVVTKSL